MIHRVSSSLASFKTLDFKPGLNVLIAQKEAGATDKQTRNRAGKTSLIEIIHFLTGAEAGPDSLLRVHALVNETFSMAFDLAREKVLIERSGRQKSRIRLNGQNGLSNFDWVQLLGEKMFGLQEIEQVQGRLPKFRSLFAYFVRRQLGGAFTTPERQTADQQKGDYQVALLFLLGLDWKIASDWQVVRDREKTLTELKKAAGAGAFGSIIGKAADLRTELTVAEARLQRLRPQVASFRVLPQYRELETEADLITRKLNQLANANVIDAATIRDLERAVQSEAPPPLPDLERIYAEAGVALPGLTVRRYGEVQSFHESIVQNRRDYLAGGLEAARQRVEAREREKQQLDERRASVMGLLRSHGALDQFANLQGEAGRMESEVASLRQRFDAAEQLEGTKNEL
jgi:uncharacterized protein YydD (DUF2326 family)